MSATDLGENIIDPYLSLIAKASLKKFSEYFNLEAGSDILQPVDELSGRVIKQWTASIYLSNAALKLLLRVHYNTKDAEALLHQKFKTTNEKDIQSLLDGLFKEYCNQWSGGVKQNLAFLEQPLGTGLPIRGLGFDEVFDHDDQLQQRWWLIDLPTPCAQVYVQVKVEIFDSNILLSNYESAKKKVEEQDATSEDGDGIEFI